MGPGLDIVFGTEELKVMAYRKRGREVVDGNEDTNGSDEAKKTNFANASQAPKFQNSWPLSPLSQVQTPNQDQWPPDDDDEREPYTLSVV